MERRENLWIRMTESAPGEYRLQSAGPKPACFCSLVWSMQPPALLHTGSRRNNSSSLTHEHYCDDTASCSRWMTETYGFLQNENFT